MIFYFVWNQKIHRGQIGDSLRVNCRITASSDNFRIPGMCSPAYPAARIRARSRCDRAGIDNNKVSCRRICNQLMPLRSEACCESLNFALVQPAADGIQKHFHLRCFHDRNFKPPSYHFIINLAFGSYQQLFFNLDINFYE